MHLAGFKYAGVSVAAAAAHLHQNVTGTVSAARGDGRRRASDAIVFSSSAATFGTPDVDLVTEETPTRPGVAVRREQAGRRVGDPRPGPRHRAAPHLAALLQRRRLGQRRPLRHQPAQPVPDRVRDAARGRDPADQRRRLRHPRRHLRARLRPRRRPRRAPTSSPPSGSPPARSCCRSTTSAAATGSSVAEIMAAIRPRHRHRLHPRDAAPAAPATPPASSPPARPPPATSTGRCATPSTTWSRSRLAGPHAATD